MLPRRVTSYSQKPSLPQKPTKHFKHFKHNATLEHLGTPLAMIGRAIVLGALPSTIQAELNFVLSYGWGYPACWEDGEHGRTTGHKSAEE